MQVGALSSATPQRGQRHRESVIFTKQSPDWPGIQVEQVLGKYPTRPAWKMRGP
jgi:hypothetical protein